jgi:hypothetical protein
VLVPLYLSATETYVASGLAYFEMVFELDGSGNHSRSLGTVGTTGRLSSFSVSSVTSSSSANNCADGGGSMRFDVSLRATSGLALANSIA